MNNRNDFYSIGQCVDYLPLEQMTVGEVCRRPKDDHPSVLFYVEKEETNDLPHLSPNLIIVLLKYLDPFAESIEFVTHIAIDVTSTCQSLLENVAECLEGKGKCHPVTLYLETGQEQVQQIEPTSKTLSSVKFCVLHFTKGCSRPVFNQEVGSLHGVIRTVERVPIKS